MAGEDALSADELDALLNDLDGGGGGGGGAAAAPADDPFASMTAPAPPPAAVAAAPSAPPGTVQQAVFSQLGPSSGGGGMDVSDEKLALLMDVPLAITVELGRTEMFIRDVVNLGPGSVIELDKLAGEAVDLLANGKIIAKGEVVVIDENFGVRITEIVNPAERARLALES